jgi:hypothetical protein
MALELELELDRVTKVPAGLLPPAIVSTTVAR